MRIARKKAETAVKTASDSVEVVKEEEESSVALNLDSSAQPGSSSLPGLHCLADVEPGERPPYSNFTLVKYAILGSPDQKLTLSEIYRDIANRFPWFQTAGKGWKNSVRHCLSLDTQFKKEPRPPTAPGKGCYWTVSLDTPRGNKRERKRNKKPSKRELAAELARLRVKPPSSFPLTTPAFRDYATTVPATPSTLSLTAAQRRASSGWMPYSHAAALVSATPSTSLDDSHVEEPYHLGDITAPGTSFSEATFPSMDHEDWDESDWGSDEELSQ